MTTEPLEDNKPSETSASYINSLGNFIKELSPGEKLIGALLVGILALLIIVIPLVPPETRVLVWFATISIVLLIYLLFRYWTKSSISKLGRIKRERNEWQQTAETLRKDYSKLVSKTNSYLFDIDHRIGEIREHITQHSSDGHMNSDEASVVVRQLTTLAEDIRRKVDFTDDAGRIGEGIETVKDAADIAKKLMEIDA
jgi:hypothetical protein